MPSPTGWSNISYVSTSNSNLIDSLLYGTKWTSGALTYSYPGPSGTSYWSTDVNTGYGPTNGDGEPWSYAYGYTSDSDRTFIPGVFQAWANVANLTFTQVNDNSTTVGDIRFAYTYKESIGFDAQAWVAEFPAASAAAGDIWFNTYGTSGSETFDPGSYEGFTVLHEIGHALGLKHPFQSYGYFNSVLPSSWDSQSFAVMSYSAKAGDQSTTFSFMPTTPMLLDVQAIQYIYGANYSYNSSNTTYSFSGSQNYHQTIWDGGGIDTIQYTSAIGGTIDLRQGYGSDLGQTVYITKGNAYLSVVHNVWIAYGAVIENASGGSGNDLIIGNQANNELTGNAGNDDMIGGAGDDTYDVDSTGDIVTEDNSEGYDFINTSLTKYTLGLNVEALNFTAIGDFTGTGNELNNSIWGYAGDDELFGEAGNDYLYGDIGYDLIDGGIGNDTMIGGAGDDTYDVDSTGDIVTEDNNEGYDFINTSLTKYTLGLNVEALNFTAIGDFTGTGNELNNSIWGYAGKDQLFGYAGNDYLDGDAGADKLVGGVGDDSYIVDNLKDVVTEKTNEGVDTVISIITYTLANNVENLGLDGVSVINGTGNALGNIIAGNSEANLLNGLVGADTLIGGAGNDTYVLDNVGDVVTEISSEGTDLVQSSITFSLAAIANVENITLTGTKAINATGNSLDNSLTGNKGANVLDGGVGNDTMIGGAGNDTYYVDATGDVVTEAANAGTDTLITSLSAYSIGIITNIENLTYSGSGDANLMGSTLANKLSGSTGNDTLSGGLGNDSLTGGAGSDTFIFDTAANASKNKDTITDFVSGTDHIQFNKVVFTGFLSIGNLTESQFYSGAGVTKAHDADDILIYNSTTGALYYDVDGNGKGAAIQVAIIGTPTHPTLAYTDIAIFAAYG